jgi:hypothetical protein
MTGGSGVEVEVDTETGHVRVLRLINVADAGTPINPRIVETQLTGAAVMQLGFTLSEEMVFTDGQLRNPSFADYKILGIRDMPEVLTGESVAARQESGPYGAKGVGETGTFGVSPAIANAIHDHRRGGLPRAAPGGRRPVAGGMMSAARRTIRFTLNGAAAECVVAPHETLVDVLRDHFELGGPRESCGQGLCAAAPCWSTAKQCRAVSTSPCSPTAPSSSPSRALPMATICIRCRRPSSRRVRSSAAFARPDLC